MMYHGVPLGMAMVPGFEQPAHNYCLIQTHVAIDHFKVFQADALNLVRNTQLMTVSTFASLATLLLKSSSSAYPPLEFRSNQVIETYPTVPRTVMLACQAGPTLRLVILELGGA
ncbi:hypothetical protein ZIOFF_067541 [Zingiber officinale]|uniref:Uncharacterized protein n=1 Tax=Zingiber officinale TaxID=94328 RepID=A0A8J5CFQ5_ZINOF|nr:hypothetical protein ZIOFF_067541 [Zingiber officinale]